MVPICLRKATWEPWGALGLPEVKAESLPETPEPEPEEPEKVQAEPLGLYW